MALSLGSPVRWHRLEVRGLGRGRLRSADAVGTCLPDAGPPKGRPGGADLCDSRGPIHPGAV